jgi:hypothetical protein
VDGESSRKLTFLPRGEEGATLSTGADWWDARSELILKAANGERGGKFGAFGRITFLISCIIEVSQRNSLCVACISFESLRMPVRTSWNSFRSCL